MLKYDILVKPNGKPYKPETPGGLFQRFAISDSADPKNSPLPISATNHALSYFYDKSRVLEHTKDALQRPGLNLPNGENGGMSTLVIDPVKLSEYLDYSGWNIDQIKDMIERTFEKILDWLAKGKPVEGIRKIANEIDPKIIVLLESSNIGFASTQPLKSSEEAQKINLFNELGASLGALHCALGGDVDSEILHTGAIKAESEGRVVVVATSGLAEARGNKVVSKEIAEGVFNYLFFNDGIEAKALTSGAGAQVQTLALPSLQQN